MGGIVSKVLGGGGGGSAPKVNLNRLFQSGESTLKGGILNLDPRVEELRKQYLEGIQGLQESGQLSDYAPQYEALAQGLASQTAGLPSQLGGITSQIGGVASQIGALPSQYSALSSNVGGLTSALGGIGGDLGSLGRTYGNIAGRTAGLGGQFGALGQEFAGNQGSLIAARISPLQQQIAQQRGELQRDIGRRRLTGSSFGNQAMSSFATESGRALGEAQALATADALGARAGLVGQQLGALGQEQQARFAQQGVLGQQAGLVGDVANLYGQQAGLVGAEQAARQAQLQALGQQQAGIGAQAELASGLTAQQAQLTGQQFGAEQAGIQNQILLNELLGGASQDVLNQELAGLGLSANTIASLLSAKNQAYSAAQQGRANNMTGLGAILGGVAGFFNPAASAAVTSPGSIGLGSVTSMPSVFNTGGGYNWLTR